MIFELSHTILDFPDPRLAEDDGLLAVGGDLGRQRLINAYQNGIFPWFNEGEPPLWFSPHERCVIFPGKIHVSGSMQKILRQNIFRITRNTAFESVISNCQKIKRKGEPGTWITKEMKDAYIDLHKIGLAQSIEVWKGDVLAGGMYGVSVNGVFCGESMFSKIPNASKVAMIRLCRTGEYSLLDCQVPNDHLMLMGAEMISQKKFLSLLKNKITIE